MSESLRCRLYLITPPQIGDIDAFAETAAATIEAGGAAALQIRLKEASEAQVAAAVGRLKPVAAARGCALILNDRPDLAASLDCDGVHVGQSDTPAEEARAIIGPDRLLGVSCQASRHLALEAAEAGADYVAFGSFFTSPTKAAPARPDPEILTIWRETTTLPCVAIGGITVHTCGLLAAAGADFVAVSAGVWSHPEGPVAAAAAFRAEIARPGGRLASPGGLN